MLMSVRSENITPHYPVPQLVKYYEINLLNVGNVRFFQCRDQGSELQRTHNEPGSQHHYVAQRCESRGSGRMRSIAIALYYL